LSKQNRFEPKVITYYELAGIVVLTFSLLILFFPKNSVKKVIQNEKSNYDLTIIYLKSIAQAYPDDPDNWLRLIEAYLQIGKIEEAKNVFERFEKKANIDKEELKILNYKLIKGEYIKSKDQTQKIKLLKELKNELENFLKSSNPSLWYFVLTESQKLDLETIQLKTLQKRVYHANYIDPAEVTKAFFLAKKLDKNDQAVRLLEYSALKSKDRKLFDLLISQYLSKKEYPKIAKLYVRKYLETKNSAHFLDAAKFYLLAENEKRALEWLKKYRNSFLDAPKTSIDILKLYLSYQKLDEARDFVLSLMKQKNQTLTKESDLLHICLDVMLYKSDLENASKLAKKGEENFKDDIYWLKKSLQIALWRNSKDEIKKYAAILYRKEKLDKYTIILQQIAKSSKNTEELIKIYKQKLSNGFDENDFAQLVKLFFNRGNFEDGVFFLKNYYKKYPKKEILRSQILLQFEYENFKTLKKAYKNYTTTYGYDSELLYKYAHKLFVRKNYQEAFETIDKNLKLLTVGKKRLWYLYADLAYVLQKEKRLLSILKRMQNYKILRKSDLETLFFLYKTNDPLKAFEIAKEDFQINLSKNSFYRLISVATEMEKKDFINDLLNELPQKLSKELEKDSYFHLIKAINFQYQKMNSLALKEFHKALFIDPYLEESHISYLWFLLAYENKKELQNELNFISKNFIPNSKTALASALGYFKLQQATKAKRYMQIALKDDPLNWQLHLQYSDILSLAGDEKGKQKHLLIAWNLAKKAAKKSENFINDKNRLYDYTRMKILFNPLNVRKYLNDIKDHLDSTTIHQLYISTLINQNALQKIEALTNAQKGDDFYIKLYLALTSENLNALKELKNQNDLLPLNEHLSLSEKIGAQKEYESLLIDAVSFNEDNNRFANSYNLYVQKRKPTVKSEIEHSNFFALKFDRIKLSYHMKESNAIGLDLAFQRKDNIKNLSKKIDPQNSFSFKLYKSFKNYKLSFTTDLNDRLKKYISFTSRISYQKRGDDVQITAATNHDDSSSNHLLLYGRKNLLRIKYTRQLNNRRSFTLGYEYATLKDDKASLGSSDHLFFDYRYYLQRAYPDISFGIFTQMKNYTKNENLPKSFIQTVLNASYAFSAKDNFHTNRGSYASGSLLYNNRSRFGYSFLAGYGGRVTSKDYLGFEAEYSSAKGSRLQEYFSWRIRYLFW